MDLHEYQAKQLLKKFGIPSPDFTVISDLKDLEKVDFPIAVLKIQIHAGGRGKAGGVKFAKNREEIKKYGKELLFQTFHTPQTGPKGLKANQLLVSPPVNIKKEYYLSAVIDRNLGVPLLIASPNGGMDIEEIAHKNPKSITKEKIKPDGSLYSFQLLNLAKFMGWEGELRKKGMRLLASLSKAFIELDASLLEINPLVETEEGDLIALDTKLSIDDNALYRQKEAAHYYDPSQLAPNEALAKKADLAYVGLDGEIGCLVNGAGLAMATMDMIFQKGGKPANFLDVGGSATEEKIAEGFKIILFDPNVKAIFVNIFGGIMDCSLIAQGIISASKKDKIEVPLIVRLEGTNVEKGKALLKESRLPIQIASNMEEGAALAINAAKGIK